MALSPGTRLGRYEIAEAIGAGGMGEVYRARDSRIGRDVALKVLSTTLSADPDRLERFELEARATGALAHPNVVSIYDVGTHEGAPYLVSELVEGETLRSLLEGPRLPPRRAASLGAQIARGLAAAHRRGIIHRDLKPENVLVTRDGTAKILDFGLAKLTAPGRAGSDGAPLVSADGLTTPGMVVGTVGYMSPEQVQGLPVDHRSDIFALGVILFEMLAGCRAFLASTPVGTLNAILDFEPPDLSEVREDLPSGFARIVRRCLEKHPENRFESAMDLAFALEELVLPASASASAARTPRGSRGRWRLALAVAGAAALLAVAFLAGGRLAHRTIPTFEALTFARGTVLSARFAPDGQSVVYTAAWEGRAARLFLKRPDGVEALALELPEGVLASVSATGELALLTGLHRTGSGLQAGTLARAPLSGSAPRDVASDVTYADWAPDGKALALMREVGRATRIEYPPERVLLETTTGGASGLRFSPAGDVIAFFEHPLKSDDRGAVALLDLQGRKTILSDGWERLDGLAWSPDEREVWFTGTKQPFADALFAVDRKGRVRLVSALPAALLLHDAARDGRVLINRDDRRAGIVLKAPGEAVERDVSWLDQSFMTDLSSDGSVVLFNENRGPATEGYAICLRKGPGEAPVVLGTGRGYALSPDGTWVAASRAAERSPLLLLPTGAGQPRPLSSGAINLESAAFFPSGKELLLVGAEPGKRTRLYRLAVEGRAPVPISPEGVRASLFGGFAISPDGAWVAAVGEDGAGRLYPAGAGEPRPLRGLLPGELPIRFAADGASLFVAPRGEARPTIVRVTLASGAREPVRQLVPADPAGFAAIYSIAVTPDGGAYAYTFTRSLSQLFVARGL